MLDIRSWKLALFSDALTTTIPRKSLNSKLKLLILKILIYSHIQLHWVINNIKKTIMKFYKILNLENLYQILS